MKELNFKFDDNIVIYAQDGRIGPGRAFWIFKAYGFPNVHVLNGGIKSWIEIGGQTEHGQETQRNEYVDVSSVKFNESMIIQKPDILEDLMSNKDLQYVDNRPSGQYDGSEQDGSLRRGHMWGAVNCPVVAQKTDDGKYRSKEQLISLYNSLELDQSTETATYCTGGIQAAEGALTLVEAGFTNVRLYDLSWSEFGSDDECKNWIVTSNVRM